MRTPIYEQVLGADFMRLHPKIQERFGISSDSGRGLICRGVMERIWHGPFYTLPFLMLGTWRNIMFPEQGRDVPFTLENWAYVDGFGRETVTWLRTFHLGKGRRFDAYMVHGPQRHLSVDYLGTHQHLAVDLHLSVADNGGLRIVSGAQRFYEGLLGFKFPMLFSGVATVCTWYDESTAKHHVEVEVRNKVWGRLFGYSGTFDVEWLDVDRGASLKGVRPIREESRY